MEVVWLVPPPPMPIVGAAAGCGVADVNGGRDAASSKSGIPPTRIVEFGASPARWRTLCGGVE
jgi:hypothetical protein